MAAFSPYVFFPFHMLLAYPLGRVFPMSWFFIPFFHLFYFGQFLVEHMADQFPEVAKYGPVLIAIGLSTSPPFFYICHSKAKNKGLVKLMILAFFLLLGGSRAMQWGFPYDDPAEQIAALTDDFYNKCHLALHVALAVILFTCSFAVDLSDKTKGD
mmetsp:Transcript_30061/g.52792  ORF Transcript_30061/g.52792 Transcript_30061/m.52792 type:complete len:156 (-) Transcript_30061:295-762(-)